MGVSFAAGGSKTLLIDGDLVGGGLTARMNAHVRRPLAQIIAREGLVTPEQLEVAQRSAAASRKPLGQVLVDLGYLRPAEMARVQAMHDRSQVGLLDALAGADLQQCITATEWPGLHVLPLGEADARHVAQLSPVAVRQLLQEAREQFDTVLVDTGPILGSLEAAMIASEADGTILALSRGEARASLDAAIEDLEAVGADILGAVFNRALDSDIVSSHMSSRVVSRSAFTEPTPAGRRKAAALIGPVASAVAAATVPDSDGQAL